jgi:subtilisin family serine protease
VATAGARTLRTYDALPYVSVQASTSAVRELRSAPEVLAVLPDEVHRPALSSSTPFVGAPAAWAAGSTGAGQTVAVIDSGVDSTHVFLAARSSTRRASPPTQLPQRHARQLGAGAAAPCSYDTDACPHGTHVAGIIAGTGSTRTASRRRQHRGGPGLQPYHHGLPGARDSLARRLLQRPAAGLDHVASLARSRPVAAVNLSLGGGSYPGTCDREPAALRTPSTRCAAWVLPPSWRPATPAARAR